MCLAVPAKVIEVLDGERAKVSLDGIVKEISVGLVDELVPGDFVIVHVGHALSKVDAAEAERTLALLAELTGGEGAAGSDGDAASLAGAGS